MTKTTYINQLSSEIQKNIKLDLINQGLEAEDIEIAMESRLCDLEDTININEYLD